MNNPATKAEAAKLTYGLPSARRAYDPAKCCKGVWSGGRASMQSQCSRKPGFGPDGLYCKQHDPEAVERRRKAASDKYEREAAAWMRPYTCAQACAGMADPEKEVAALKACAVALAEIAGHCFTTQDCARCRGEAQDALAALAQARKEKL